MVLSVCVRLHLRRDCGRSHVSASNLRPSNLCEAACKRVRFTHTPELAIFGSSKKNIWSLL